MLHFRLENGIVKELITDTTGMAGEDFKGVESRWDWKTMEQAEAVAASATAELGVHFMATDSGEWVSPRFDVITAPALGEPVSYSFNGDYYPCGNIVKISKDMKIVTTSEGQKFYRRRLSGKWLQRGTWAMVHGHIDRRNPHF